jgi:hypothetical protein
MADLRAEINRRRGAEDNCITIEHQRERHQNIEGRNLENDFDSHALVRGSLVAHAPCFPTSPGVSRGGGAWRLAYTCVWWSDHTSSTPIYRRSMMGPSTPLNFCRSTPPPFSL